MAGKLSEYKDQEKRLNYIREKTAIRNKKISVIKQVFKALPFNIFKSYLSNNKKEKTNEKIKAKSNDKIKTEVYEKIKARTIFKNKEISLLNKIFSALPYNEYETYFKKNQNKIKELNKYNYSIKKFFTVLPFHN